MLWKAHISKQHGCRLETKDLYVNWAEYMAQVVSGIPELFILALWSETDIKSMQKFKQIVILLNNVIFYAYSSYIFQIFW
jgi:hypothetical protein